MGLPYGHPRDLAHLLLIYSAYYQGVEFEVEQPRFNPAPHEMLVLQVQLNQLYRNASPLCTKMWRKLCVAIIPTATGIKSWPLPFLRLATHTQALFFWGA